MSLYRQQGSKVWWYEFQFRGRRIRASSKTTVKEVARDALRARRRQEEESFNGIRRPEPPKTFAEAAQELIDRCRPFLAANTMAIKERSVRYLLPFLGKKALCDITTQDIQRVVAARLAQGDANRYVNMIIETLREILRRNHQWERLRPDYRKLKEPKRVGKALSHKEEKTLLDQCRKSTSRVLHPVATLGLYAGMRRDEIRWLQWYRVDLRRGFLTVGKSKTSHGEGRLIPLIGPALQVMKGWASRFPKRLPDHYVFPAERYWFDASKKTGEVYSHNPSKPMGSWRKAWEAARCRAGVHLRFHDLRHTAVTRMLEGGRTLEQIAPIMGWSAATMYQMSLIYAEWSLEAKRKTMSALVRPKKRAGSKKTHGKKLPAKGQAGIERLDKVA